MRIYIPTRLSVFSPPVQTGPGATQPPIQRVPGLSLLVKRPGRGVDHPTPPSVEIKERVELCLYSPSGPSWPVIGWTLPLPLPLPLFSFLLSCGCTSCIPFHFPSFCGQFLRHSSSELAMKLDWLSWKTNCSVDLKRKLVSYWRHENKMSCVTDGVKGLFFVLVTSEWYAFQLRPYSIQTWK